MIIKRFYEAVRDLDYDAFVLLVAIMSVKYLFLGLLLALIVNPAFLLFWIGFPFSIMFWCLLYFIGE